MHNEKYFKIVTGEDLNNVYTFLGQGNFLFRSGNFFILVWENQGNRKADFAGNPALEETQEIIKKTISHYFIQFSDLFSNICIT